MNSSSDDIKKAYFIKLGKKGEWERDCLDNDILRLGYTETPDAALREKDWVAVRSFWLEKRKGKESTATRDRNQIRIFYESGPETLFITFYDGRMFWCRPTGDVERLKDGSHLRRTVSGWSDKSFAGTPLTTDRLSGALLKVQGYRGTICAIEEFAQLLQRLKDEVPPAVVEAEEAELALKKAIRGMMPLLTPQDFELLIDLVFTNSGWRRISVLGKTTKTLDLELLLPTTGERAFVQVKSRTTAAEVRSYIDRFEQSELYDRMFFTWHTGSVDADIEGVTLIPPERLAELVLASGLSPWLREKAGLPAPTRE